MVENLPMEDFNRVYICGLELEEPTGMAIIEFLEEHTHLEIFYAPGTRFTLIDPAKNNRLFELAPILHLNRDEALDYRASTSIEEAAKGLYALTKKELIITYGSKGSYFYDGVTLTLVPSAKAKVVDTIGAGDAHIGAIIAGRQLGYDYLESLAIANKIYAAVVGTKGATLSDTDFSKLEIL